MSTDKSIPEIWCERLTRDLQEPSPFWSQFIRHYPPLPPPNRRERFRRWRKRTTLNLREGLALRVAPWLKQEDWYDS